MLKSKIYKLSDGRFSYKRTDLDGKPRQIKSRVNESKDDFRLRCLKLDRQLLLEAGLAKEPFIKIGEREIKTFDDLFYLWLDLHAKTSLSLSSQINSQQLYENHLKDRIGPLPLDEIKRQEVFMILKEKEAKNYSQSFIKKLKGIISGSYNFAINSFGLEISSPVEGLRFEGGKKARKKEKILRKKELLEFLRTKPGGVFLYYYLILFFTGLRPSEALALRYTDFDEDFLYVKRAITNYGLGGLKNEQSERKIPLNPKIRLARDRQAEKHMGFRPYKDYLFTMSSNEEPSMNALQLDFDKRKEIYKDKTGKSFDYSLYDFRHAFASQMAEANMPLKALQSIMGHVNITTTMNYYVQLSDKMMEDAIDYMEKM